MSVQVKDFDGAGDDATAIQAAINKTWLYPARGGVVELEPREYQLSGPIYMPPRTTLRGEGYMTTRLIAAPNFSGGEVVLMAYNRTGPVTDYCHAARIEGVSLVGKPGVSACRVVCAGEHTGLYNVQTEAGSIIHEGLSSTLHLWEVSCMWTGAPALILRATKLDPAAPSAYSGISGGRVHIWSLKCDHQPAGGPVIALNGAHQVVITGWAEEAQVAGDSDMMVLVTNGDLGGGPATVPATPTVEVSGADFDLDYKSGRPVTVFACDNTQQTPHFVWNGRTLGSQLVRTPSAVVGSQNGIGSLRFYGGKQQSFGANGDGGSNLSTTTATVTELDADVKMTSALQTAQGARLDAAAAQAVAALATANGAAGSYAKLKAALSNL